MANAVIGQWQVLSDKSRIATVSKRNEVVSGYPDSDREAEANARLIAAAPNLLNLCKRTLWALNAETQKGETGWQPLITELENTINQATKS